MFLECRHIMPNGTKCQAPAVSDKPYCYFHNRLHRLASRPASAPDEPLKLPILEDRSAIQLALSQILDALGSSRIDTRQASLFLYALQIASQNVQRDRDIVPRVAVRSMTLTSGGDELAPAVFSCPVMSQCSTCEQRDTCEDFEPDEYDDED
jgi:hypothetical protein